MLDVLAPLSKVALFEEQGHLFPAEELIPGTTLDRWAAGRTAEHVMRWDGLAGLAGRLIAAVRKVHEAGLVIRGLKPTNVMVTLSNDVRMIDAEHVAELGQSVLPAFTPAFIAPKGRRAGLRVEVTDPRSRRTASAWVSPCSRRSPA